MVAETIGAIGSVLGGLGSIAGGLGLGGSNSAKKIAREQMAMQREFAQEGIQWRVADAKAAGIHPLYALGAQLPSYQPSTYVGDEASSPVSSLAQGGQDIAHGLERMLSGRQKLQTRLDVLSVERAELENNLLASRLARLNQQATPPFPDLSEGESAIPIGAVSDPSRYANRAVSVSPLPVNAMGPYGDVEPKKPEQLGTLPQDRSGEGGLQPDYQLVRTGSHSWTTKPSSHYNIDDFTSPNYISWQVRNSVLPALAYKSSYPYIPVSDWPRGTVGFTYNPARGTFEALDYIPQGDPHFISAAEMVMSQRRR